MPVERMRCPEGSAALVARRVRTMVARGASVADLVHDIVQNVRRRGDEALLDYERRYGHGGAPLRVPAQTLHDALDKLDPRVREGLEVARANVGAVARESLTGDREVTLPQGQRVVLREVPVRRAAIYAPGGQAPYPSTIVMAATTAEAAGVPEIVACATHPVMLAACALCGVEEVYSISGAQAVAALAFGTQTVKPVDVIAGPGSLYSQEAKRQVFGRVGIDGFAGPSDLVVVASEGADAKLIALDLLAQAEHGAGTLVAAVSPGTALLDAVEAELPDESDAAMVLVQAESVRAALAFSEALAPEHLQLVGRAAEELAPRVTSAGCVFVGAAAGTAFGDYVAGSNHVLPTEGAARFASGLNVRHFLRRMNEVHLDGAAAALAPAGAAIARAEGFEAHARSMEARL